MFALAQLIDFIARLLILIVVIDAVLSFFMPPYHPIRTALGRIVNPMLEPIRRVVPPLGMFDISPLILILLIQFLSRVLISLLVR
ncbi:MAG: YggT family protein [Anaerolineales bacterium]